MLYYYKMTIFINTMSILVEGVTKKWVNLRDTYVSNKRRYELAIASGAPATDEPKWKWWPHMKWYSDFRKTKSTKLVFLLAFIRVSVTIT